MLGLEKFRKSILATIKVCMVFCFILAFVDGWQNNYTEALFKLKGNYLVVLVYFIVLFSFLRLYGSFKVGILRLHEVLYSCGLSIFLSNCISYLILCLIAREMLTVKPIILISVVQFVMAFVYCYIANGVYFKLYKVRNILAIFDSTSGDYNVIKKMRKIKERYTIDKGITIDRPLREIFKEIDSHDSVLICDFDTGLKNQIFHYCYINKKRIYSLPSTDEIILNSGLPSQIFDTPVIICRNHGLSLEQRILKRAFDILLSSVGIIISGPIMLITAAAIKICDGGPVFFKQNRVTINNNIFNVIKFRSMIVDADKDGAKKATDNDDRITPVGKVIRRFRIDELPQLFNVLFGSMSIVGPRPERTENVYEYSTQLPEFNLRHRVKGGITGYAQIYGKYNTTPADKLNMDLIYIENYSVFQDIKLVVMTLKILFVKESTEGFDEKANAKVVKAKKEKIK